MENVTKFRKDADFFETDFFGTVEKMKKARKDLR